ncbi:MAG TPA: DUF732 domain-containing protein [Pseudonocardia sp.]|jgi:hypothetical protein|nr:DUF732 domain-containing protein [Pseudonocardia sp.]
MVTIRRNAAAVVMLAAVAFCMACSADPQPPPNAPSRQDLALRTVLAERHLDAGSSAQVSELGKMICQTLSGPNPDVQNLVQVVQVSTGFSGSDTGFVLGAAVQTYCPDQLSKLPTS